MRLTNSLCFFILVCIMACMTAKADSAPRHEMRSVWLQTVWNGDWPKTKGTTASVATKQKAELTALLDSLVNANFNCAALQVRPASDALYKSSYEPWSEWLTGKRGSAPTYDPLEFFVSECHRRGLEAHVWINPYRTRSGSTSFDTSAKSKGWLISYNSKLVLDPGNVDVQNHVVKVITEIVTNYDIDGVMFDDYFYPEDLPVGSGYDYNEWKASGSKLNQEDWRRENCNTLVRKVAEAINARKPYVRFGIGPAGVAGGNGVSSSRYGLPACYSGKDWVYDGIFCDALAWLADGSVDYISPQIYWSHTHSTNPYQPIARWWSEVAVKFNRHFFASHSTSSLSTEEVARQIETNRTETLDGFTGSVMFNTSSTFINKSATPIKQTFKYHATTPPMTWYKATDPGTIKSLTRNGNTLTASALSGTRYIFYAVPSGISRQKALSDRANGLKAEYVLGVSYGNTMTVPGAKSTGHWYAVAPLDRYGNEWNLTTTGEPASKPAQATKLIVPENGTEVSDDIYFVFEKADVDSYRLDIAGDYDFKQIVYSRDDAPMPDSFGWLQYAVPSSILKNGTFYWRIITRKAGFLDNMSETRNIVVNSHYSGDGYVSIAESNSYAYQDPANTGAKYRLTNMWIRSSNHGNQIDFVSGDNHTRDFTLSNDGTEIYMVQCQPGTSEASIRRFDSGSGLELETLPLSTDADYSNGLHGLVNTIMTDSRGNICVTGMKLAAGSQISVGKVNMSTGKVTTIVSIPESTLRIDHTAITGDVDGTFRLFAATSNATTVYRWTVTNGKLTKTEKMNITNPGYNPRVIAVDDDHIFIDGTASSLSYYTWGNSKPTGTFASAPDLSPVNLIDGGAFFTYEGMPMLVYGTGTYGTGIRYRLAYGKTLPSSYSGLQSLWEFPVHAQGIGTSDPRNDRGVLVKVHGSGMMTRSESQPVYVYTFAPANGLAAYRVDRVTVTGVDVISENRITMKRNGSLLHFSDTVDRVEIYSVSGNQVGAASQCDSIEINLESGLYIVVVTVGQSRQTCKIII